MMLKIEGMEGMEENRESPLQNVPLLCEAHLGPLNEGKAGHRQCWSLLTDRLTD